MHPVFWIEILTDEVVEERQFGKGRGVSGEQLRENYYFNYFNYLLIIIIIIYLFIYYFFFLFFFFSGRYMKSWT